jgi:TolA-binding protein
VRRVVASALLAAALSGDAFAGDLIVLADGRILGAAHPTDPPSAADFAASNISISEETLDGITYRLAGVATRQTLPRPQVKRVLHDPTAVPADLTEGAALVGKGKFVDARARFAAGAKNVLSPPWAQAESAYRLAESYATQGDATAAERALAAFAQERPRSRFVPEALRLRARLLFDLGREDEAKSQCDAVATVLGATEDEALAAKFAAAWIDARSAIRSGDAKRAKAAADAFDDLRARAGGHAAVLARCAVAKAACGGGGDGLADVVAASDDPFVLAVGQVVVADALRKRAKEKTDRAALEEAQERYLRVVVLHADAEDAADFVAAAQFHAGETFLELAADDPAGAAEAKTRARREWDDVVRRFPKSEWAKRARTAAAGLQ